MKIFEICSSFISMTFSSVVTLSFIYSVNCLWMETMMADENRSKCYFSSVQVLTIMDYCSTGVHPVKAVLMYPFTYILSMLVNASGNYLWPAITALQR